MKKVLILIFTGIFIAVLPQILAQNFKMDISTPGEIFESGQNVTFKVTLLDNQDNPISDQIQITVYDAWEREIIKETFPSNQLNSFYLEPDFISGNCVIKASYQDVNAIKVMTIKEIEIAKFEIQNEKLIVTNIGNKEYERKIEIKIGETIGSKIPKIAIGKSASYRLIAPEGVYDIKVSDGVSKDLIRQEVKLTGTGNVVGAIDESLSKRSGITGINPESDENVEFFSYVKNSKFSYVFILVIFGAMVLLAIERNVQKRNGTPATPISQTQISYK